MAEQNSVEETSAAYAQQEELQKSILAEYDLAAEDYQLLDTDAAPTYSPVPMELPVLAIIGRANVGKSTLVNRILGQRLAIVEDQPGVTRDRVRYPAEWNGRKFILMDTGGWEVSDADIDRSVSLQAEYAIAAADALVLVVDATVGDTATDDRIVEIIRKSAKPVILAANKVDSPKQEAEVALLWGMGLGEPYPISALHGRGIGELLDAALAVLPAAKAAPAAYSSEAPRRIALVGKPNVGKSSLLNKLAGENRVVVDDLAGTTRDPVDEFINLDGEDWILVDTAGIRRRVHLAKGADYYASLRTQGAIEKAELALVLIDAAQELTEQDIRIMQQVVDAGRAMVLVCNKWDLVDEERQAELNRELEAELVQMEWVERVNISAATGWHTNRIAAAMRRALESWDKRISTAKLNSFLSEVAAANPHPVRGGKQPRLLFATQVESRPPRFVFFTTGFMDHGYRRFLAHRLRDEFGFSGTPLEISVRERQRRKKD